MNKVIAIGLDAACFDIVQPWLDAGRLPTLQELLKSGVYTPMRSVIPPYTAAAWTTIMTGRDVDEHGAFDFVELKENVYEPRFVNSTDVRAPYIWELAEQQGLKSIVVNVPLTHPPREMKNGVLIPGNMAPEHPLCHPPHLLDELKMAIGDYRLYWDNELDDSASFDDKLDGFLKLSRMRRDAVLYLSQQYDWDLLVVQFQRTDSVFHILNKEGIPTEERKVVQLFAAIDGYIQDIINAHPGSIVFLVSDHGMGLTKWTFSVNTWLKSKGYLRAEVGSSPDAFEIDAELVGVHKAKKADRSSKGVERVLAMLARVGLSKQRIEEILLTLRLDKVVRRIVPYWLLRMQAGSEQIDWEQSLAFCYLPSGYGISINVRGREPAGIVEPGLEYEELCSRLVDELSQLRDPDGEMVFDVVARREEMYGGDQLRHIPDIVLKPRASDYRLEKRLRGDAFIRNHYYYSHKMDGLFIAWGSNVRSEIQDFAGMPTILDFAPTVLYALGLPVDSSMRGRVLREVFSEQFVEDCPPRRAAYVNRYEGTATGGGDVNSDDEQLLTERLRALGYLD